MLKELMLKEALVDVALAQKDVSIVCDASDEDISLADFLDGISKMSIVVVCRDGTTSLNLQEK